MISNPDPYFSWLWALVRSAIQDIYCPLVWFKVCILFISTNYFPFSLCRSASLLWVTETSTQRPFLVVSLLSSASHLESSSMAYLYQSFSTSSQTITQNSNPTSTQPPWKNEGRWDLPRGQWKRSVIYLEAISVRLTESICAFYKESVTLWNKTSGFSPQWCKRPGMSVGLVGGKLVRDHTGVWLYKL